MDIDTSTERAKLLESNDWPLKATEPSQEGSKVDGSPDPVDDEKEAQEAANSVQEGDESEGEKGEEGEVEQGEAEPEEEASAEDDSKAKFDADTEKRIAAIQLQEKRSKAAIAQERAEIESLKQQVLPAYEALKEFTQLKQRVNSDPVGVLRALGMTEDDFDHAARQLYYHGKEAAKDPKSRERAELARASKEQNDVMRQALAEIKELKTQISERDRIAKEEQEVNAFLGKVHKNLGDSTPILRSLNEKRPEQAKKLLIQAAVALYNETGLDPEPAEVAKRAEEDRRLELEESGVPVDKIFSKTSPATANKNQTAAKRVSQGSVTTPKAEPKDRAEELADVRRALLAGRLE